MGNPIASPEGGTKSHMSGGIACVYMQEVHALCVADVFLRVGTGTVVVVMAVKFSLAVVIGSWCCW